MEKRGITQKQLGDLIGLSQGAVSKWVNPDEGTLPGGEALVDLSTALGVSIDSLMGLEAASAGVLREEADSFGVRGATMVNALRNVNEPTRSAILSSFSRIVDQLPREPVKYGGKKAPSSSSSVASEAKAISEKAEALGLDRDPELQRLRKVAEPSGKKGRPSRGVSRGSKVTPFPPEGAQE